MKSVNRKLILKKEIVSNLNVNQLAAINGGTKIGSVIVRTAPDSGNDTGVIDGDTKIILDPPTVNFCGLTEGDCYQVTGNTKDQGGSEGDLV